MKHCSICGKEMDGKIYVLTNDEWTCMACHSRVVKERDDEYYGNLVKGLKNTLKEKYLGLRRKQ